MGRSEHIVFSASGTCTDAVIITCVVIVMPICLWMESSPGRGHATYICVAVVAGHMDIYVHGAYVLVTNGHHHQQVPVALAGAWESRAAGLPATSSQPTGGGVRLAYVVVVVASDPIVSSANHACIHVGHEHYHR